MRLNRRQFALTATAAATAMGVPVRAPQMVGNGTLDLAGPAQIPKFEEMVGVPYRLHGAGYNEVGFGDLVQIDGKWILANRRKQR